MPEIPHQEQESDVLFQDCGIAFNSGKLVIHLYEMELSTGFVK